MNKVLFVLFLLLHTGSYSKHKLQEKNLFVSFANLGQTIRILCKYMYQILATKATIYCFRKPTTCICENKGTDQLRGYCKADQFLCFHYRVSTIPLLSKSKICILQSFCGCTARFVSELVGNPDCWFSHRKTKFKKEIFDPRQSDPMHRNKQLQVSISWQEQ